MNTTLHNNNPLFCELTAVSCQVNGVTLAENNRVIDFSGMLSLEDIRLATIRLTRDFGYDYFCPTIITTSMEVYKHNLTEFAKAMQEDWGSSILGVHLEGPALNANCIGAHPVFYNKTYHLVELFSELLDYCKLSNGETGVAMVTLAPELDKTGDALRFLSSKGVVVSIGHHQADPDDIERVLNLCRDSGCAFTHYPNAWTKPLDRTAMLSTGAMFHSKAFIMQVVDGRHVPDDIIKWTYKFAGERRFIICPDESPLLGALPREKPYKIFSGREFSVLRPETPPKDTKWPTNDTFPHSHPLSGSTVPLLAQIERFHNITGVDKNVLELVAGENALQMLKVPLTRLGRSNIL
jgi:N-acetylglucosamine-6-phosphate deacetylase